MVAGAVESVAGGLFAEVRVWGECEGAGEGEGDRGVGGFGGVCAVPSGGGELEEEEHAGVFGLVRGASAHDEET